MLDTVALDRDGWLAVPGVLTAEAADGLARRCADVLADKRDRRMNDKPASGTTRATELLDRLPELHELLDGPDVRAAVEHLLGATADLRDATLRCPRPGFGEQTLHSDGLTLDPGVCDGVTCIVALCAFTPFNGSTAVVSGSHLWPAGKKHADGPHEHASAEQRFIGPAGTAFVFSAQLLHRGTRNDGDDPRPALQTFWRRG
jgi:Phytanoyl-CoA dioxygenase (PhyH)